MVWLRFDSQAFSNTIGLFLCMLFLGYGLVEFPRNLWLQANYQMFLRQCEGRASSTKNGVSSQAVPQKSSYPFHPSQSILNINLIHGDVPMLRDRQLERREKEYSETLTDLELFETLLQDVNEARDGTGQPDVAQDLHDKLQQVRGLSRSINSGQLA